jgi:hypothetical protein
MPLTQCDEEVKEINITIYAISDDEKTKPNYFWS